ncbi:ParA family protein [Bacillus pseudomycoides]|uniref:ParA family protein n=1 Tax=Bacillus pseudomycoides TaxID=64104 RepID=UPI0023DA3DFB|nr:AAA family ATPase [Bacillus pseudomycoides]MDF2084638.1 AAA family ATPase [Bacillus pseudomycoides]
MSEEATKIGKVISFINMKGGVSKTTLCKEIGYTLSKQNKKVLLIDIDPQANLTQSFFRLLGYKHDNQLQEEAEEGSEADVKESKYTTVTQSIHKIFNSSKFSPVTKEDAILELSEYLSLIPGDLSTIFMERNPADSSLYNFIDDFQLKTEFEYILIDCPPTYSFYTVTSMLCSDHYFIPVKPDSYSTLGIDLLEQVVAEIKNNNRSHFTNNPLSNLGLIFTVTNQDQSRNTGERKLISHIMDSKIVKNKGISIFSEEFTYYNMFPKKIEYFLIDSNSTQAKQNLLNIIDEFESKLS